MPKVFVSYRRADGPYGVGWLAERLRRLDLADPETVFVDATMRAGDDFPAVLEDAVRESSIVLAVIGPHWRGDRGETSPARIMEQDDWVVRELRLADEHGKHVMPVTLAGEPISPPKTTRDAFSWSLDIITIASAQALVTNLAFHLGMDLRASADAIDREHFLDLAAHQGSDRRRICRCL